ncbi:DUF2914 domain-containing protein [Aestuariibacter halophilus]|uniref:DUF2914 domain-containing protein n=1 Tax=Fluctibacter halophilus TaxID=226011 RepID=A0ABS8GBT5_9ALTE|nr:DUF2914 domain-containing protein [Aestuariibacter halophilus]MCC2617541.1 DUF2914 domain-containing protein [Aestuariibacter halophilus]
MFTRLVILVGLLLCTAVNAQVARFQLTTGIAQREPVDDLGSTAVIPAEGITTLYFFTAVDNMAGKTLIHRWLYKGQEMASVALPIRSNHWRTYSSKRIMSDWQGEWQIQVWQDDLQITQHTFTLSSDQ